MRPSTRGQAALEYVGLLSLLAVVLGAASAAMGAGPLGGVGSSVLAAVRHGLCLVAGGVCTQREARAAGLDACPVHLRSNREEAGVSVAIVRLGRGDALVIERRSDGTASVSFVDHVEAGAEAGVGMRFTPVGAAGAARAGLGAVFAAGRTWDFPSWEAAGRFVARHARHETLTGEVRGRLCFWCRGDGPPAPQATYHEGGGYADAKLDAGMRIAGGGAQLDAHVGAATVLGRRVAGARRTTYLRISGESVGRLGALIGSLGTSSSGTAVLEITSQAGRPVTLRVAGAAALAGELAAFGASSDVRRLAAALRAARAGAGQGNGMAGEIALTLDLRDPVNLAALHGVLSAGGSPAELARRLAVLGRRLDTHGTVDLHVFRAGVDRKEADAGAGLGIRLGAAYERVEQGRELVGAWTSVAGGPLREREDCLSRIGR